MMRTADVIVIGGGILGAAVLYGCARAGLDAVLLERRAINREGSFTTGANIHAQSLHLKRPDQDLPVDAERFLALQIAASELWGEVEDELELPVGFQRCGGFTVAETEEEKAELERKYAIECRAGLVTEILEGNEARARLPLLSETVIATDYCAMDGFVDPYRAAPAYLQAARRLGAGIYPYTPVTSIRSDGEIYEITTERERWGAPRVVNAAGPWIDGVGRLAGLEIEMAPCAIQMHATAPTASVMPCLVQHIGQGLSVKQVRNGSVVVGGGWPAETFDLENGSEVSQASIRGNMELAQRILPFLANLPLGRAWTGPLAATPDEMPVVGEVSSCPGFFVVGGTYGVTLAPLWGDVVTDLVLGRKPSLEVRDLGPDRLLRRASDAQGEARTQR